jgi:hypothetical protein
MNFETKRINSAPDAIAPDGSEVDTGGELIAYFR